ncbi:MAG TPA: hypothetical protein VGP15_01850 [Burkholderiales bacterium]|nr:hypothetical protein [Burkholderiales bacterium]
MTKSAAAAACCLAAAYPFAVYFGLEVFEPRHLAGLVVLVALCRAATVRRLCGAVDVVIIGVTASLAAGIAWSNSEALLRFYPVVVTLGLLATFGWSLWRRPSMIERFARLREPALSDAAVAYTRRVTQLWCVFFVFNAAVALYTALAASRATWALYNGFLSYVLVGTLFAIEWLVRRRVLHRVELASGRG